MRAKKEGTIERRRKLLGLNRQQLADMVGVHRMTVYRWEVRGVMPDLKNMVALKYILRLSAVELFYDYYLAAEEEYMKEGLKLLDELAEKKKEEEK